MPHYAAATSYRYDGAGRPTVSTDPLSNTTITAYNLDGTTQKVATPQNGSGSQFSQYSYDNNGKQLAVSDPVTGTAGADGTTIAAATTNYYADQRTMTSTDTGGDKTQYAYDPAGNPQSVTSPNCNVTSYTYTIDNLLATLDRPLLADGSHYDIAYNYDGAGRKTQTTNSRPGASTPAGGSQSTAWYPDGQAKTQTGRNNENITQCWDAGGNLLEAISGTSPATCASTDGRTLPSGTAASATHLTRNYYLDDQLRTASDGANPATYSWDALGQPASRQLGTSVSPTGVGTTNYSYSDAENLTGLQDSRPTTGSGTWNRTYDSSGQPATGTMPNGNTLAWSFNNDGTVASQTQTPSGGGNPVEKHAYSDDQLRRTLTDALTTGATTTTDTYSYTAANRLASWNNGTTTQYGQWDADGNRTCYGTSCASGSTPAAGYKYAHNSDDSLATWTVPSGPNAGLHTVAYDSDGRRTADGNACYGYDGFDRTTSTYSESTGGPCSGAPSMATPGVSYSYDPLNRQASRTGSGVVDGIPDGTTTIGYDAGSSQETTETTGSSTTSWVLNDSSNPLADTTGTATKYLVDDGHGNITAETNSTGVLTCLTQYDPFGNTRGTDDPTTTQNSPCDKNAGTADGAGGKHTTANDLLYSSQRRDAHTNDYQLGSRTYDPANAVFTTPDSNRAAAPAGQPGVGTDPLTANTYNYVNGNPLNYVDPTGHRIECDNPCSKSDQAAISAATYQAHHNGLSAQQVQLQQEFGRFADPTTTLPAYHGLAANVEVFSIPKGTGAGILTGCFFIESKTASQLPLPLDRGDGVSRSSKFDPDQCRASQSLDLQQGRGVIRVSPTCTAAGDRCEVAHASVDVYQGSGEASNDIQTTNPLEPGPAKPFLKVRERLYLQLSQGSEPKVSGLGQGFPSVEYYYRPNALADPQAIFYRKASGLKSGSALAGLPPFYTFNSPVPFALPEAYPGPGGGAIQPGFVSSARNVYGYPDGSNSYDSGVGQPPMASPNPTPQGWG